MLTNRQMDKKQTSDRTELHPFQKEPSYDGELQNYTHFKRSQAMMVIPLPVKFEFDWTHRFRVRVRKRKFQWTNNRWNYTNFERNLAVMVIYVPVKFEIDWTNRRFRVIVWKQKCGWTDGWTKNGQNSTWNYTNFERNLGMMVI